MHEGFQQIHEGVIPPRDRGWFVETAPNPSTDSLDSSTARQLAVNRHLCSWRARIQYTRYCYNPAAIVRYVYWLLSKVALYLLTEATD